MSTGKSPSRSFDKAALQSGIDKLGRALRELESFEVSEINQRGDARLDHLQKKTNSTLADILGHGSAEYRKHAVAAFDGSLDMTFGDRYSMDEYRDALEVGIAHAMKNVTAVRQWLRDQLDGSAGKQATAATPAPTAAPTPAPTAAPTPAPTSAPTPAPTAAPTPPPTAAPTSAPTAAPTPAPTAAPTPAPTTAPKRETLKMNKPTSAPANSSQQAGNRRILVLGQGGDEIAGQIIGFLGQMDLEPAVIDAPTVERLDALREAAFAVLLPSKDMEAPATMLSIGFMLAVLGRSRICLMAEPGQAIPAVLEGVLRIAPDDTGVWPLLLAREMKRAGIEIDLNRAL